MWGAVGPNVGVSVPAVALYREPSLHEVEEPPGAPPEAT